jgi:Na+/H+ antiporter NhaC
VDSPIELLRRHPGRVLGAAAGLVALALLPLVPGAADGDGAVFGWTALVPPLVAITLAVVTRRLFLSLGAAVVVGALLVHGPVRAVPLGLRDYAWNNLLDRTHLYILGFTLALLGMVHTMARSGGARGIVVAVSRWVRSARSTRVCTSVMGVLVFFDDYANCMLVGPTMRPLADRYRLSREKLAYLVDSTAAPVSGLILLSTWVGYEVGLLGDVAKTLGLTETGYALLFAALPMRFYCALTLVFVFASSAAGRDFGPMLAAERRAHEHGKLMRDGAQPLGQADPRHTAPPADKPHRWINAALPIAAVVIGTLAGFVFDGGGGPRLRASPASFFSFSFWRETLSASENNVTVLFWAALAGATLAILLPAAQRVLSLSEAVVAFGRGVRAAGYAAAVLLLAWALAQVCKDLGTGPIVVAALGGSLPPVVVPAVTFLAAAAVAFATGTSWGTMAILIPTAVPLAHAVGGVPLMLLSMAAVLDGAIFGDHCSPISDTTLMSSIAAGCDHIDHVATQLPYAMVVMVVAVPVGYVAVASGGPIWLSYLLGVSALLIVLFGFGRRLPLTPPGEPAPTPRPPGP